MSEGLRQKIIFGVFAVAVVWGAYNLWPRSADSPALGETPIPAATASRPLNSSNPQPAVSDEELAGQSWGLDPFRPRQRATVAPAAKRTAELTWILSGIVYNKTNPMAIINRKMTRVGDTIDEARVVEIERKTVTLERRGKQFTITVTKG